MNLCTIYRGLQHNLEEFLSTLSEPYDGLFLNSICKNEIDVVKYLIDQNFPIESLDMCFTDIIRCRNLEILKVFVRAGYMINPILGKVFFKGTNFPCMKERSIHLAKFLFESGININYDFDYATVYVSDENIELLDYLITNNMINNSSMNLIYKNYAYSLNFIKMLFKHNSSMNLEPYLMKAVLSKDEDEDDDEEIIKFLILNGANLSEEVIRTCYTNRKYNLLKLLLENGARADSISLLDIPIVKLLYDYGGRI